MAKAFLKEHPEALQKIEGLVLEKFGVRRGPVAVPARRSPPRTEAPRVKAVR